MFIKKIDFLSPRITFYYKGALSHSSIISGIISIFCIILIVSLAIYFSKDLFQRKNPKAYYFNTFIKDAGFFPMNSSSFFHFLSMYEKSDDLIDKGIDFRYLRIIGLSTYFHHYLVHKNIYQLDHWLYGFCNNETDTQGIGYLFDNNNFKNFACIRKYFNATEKKYYDTSNPNFRWPIMAHGTLNLKKTNYNIIVERCKEESINYILGEGSHCSNDMDMNEFLALRGAIHLNFIDNYIDLLNFKKPIVKFLYRIENGLDADNYSINNLNFNPITIKSNNGYIIDLIKTDLSYSYQRNDVFTHSINGSDIYMIYYFWLNNRMHYYERAYKKVQDVISSIGGISEVIYFLSIFINYLYNNYIIIYDTKELLSSSIDEKKNIRNNITLNTSKVNRINIYKDKLKVNIGENSEKGIFNDISKDIENNIISHKNSNKKVSFSSKFIDKSEKSKNGKEKNLEIVNNSKSEINNFCNFLLHKFSCEKQYIYFKVYKDFRTKIISEEHLIKNHLNIYNLLRVAEGKLNFARNSYRLKDLIKLV